MKININIKKLYRAHSPQIKRFCVSEINRQILKNITLYVKDDEPIFLAALLQNPFGKTENLSNIRKTFGNQVWSCLRKLNRLHELETPPEETLKNRKEIVILYLITVKHMFKYRKKFPVADRMISPKRIRFVMKLLERIEVTEIRIDLEDVFFAYLQPEIYANYRSILRYTKFQYNRRISEIVEHFNQLLKKSRINAEIQARVKTIHSIHQKIIKRNLLFSQILDTVGIRIVVNNEEDCYRTMVLVLKNAPIMTSKVKDYIAVPKENGYQSIHLTIFHDGNPIEIQIRSREMHYHAQFGNCCHVNYKQNAQ